jgi:hypothetical protein
MIKIPAALCLVLLAAGLVWTSHGNAQLYGRTSQDSASLQAGGGTPENVLIILDASDSMNEKMGGQTKFQIAKDVILKTVQNMPPNVNVGLRVYGHRLGRRGLSFQGPFGAYTSGGEICRQTQLLVPLGMSNRASIAGQLLDVQAVGKTPITYSLAESVRNDFAGIPGNKTIILVSDGRETCSYNPCDYVLEAVRQGIDIKINTIGFATRDRVADQQLKCVALATKGKFYTANTAADLAKSLQDSAKVQTSVQAKIYPGPPAEE